MGNPTHGFGTTFTWNSQVVAGLTNINGIELSADKLEVTTHQSTNSSKEFILGLLEASDVTLEGQFDYTDSTGQLAMVTDMQARTSRTAIITFPAATGSTWTFTGLITKLKIGDAPIDGKIPFAASVSVTGKPVFAVSTSAGLTTPFLAFSTGTIIPVAAQATTTYVLEVITGTTSITITPTASAGVITITSGGVSQTVASGNASSAITLGAAGSVTVVTVSVQETNKAPKVYTINVARA